MTEIDWLEHYFGIGIADQVKAISKDHNEDYKKNTMEILDPVMRVHLLNNDYLTYIRSRLQEYIERKNK
jgi:hypothetical protein